MDEILLPMCGLLAGLFGGWEIVLVLAVILILAVQLPRNGTRLKAEEKTPVLDSFTLWLAQGFDLGRIPVAPGTFGSLAGLLWTAILIVPGSLTIYCAGTALGLAASVLFCGEAERILREKDPPSVVLDEIAALPLCFLPWIVFETLRQHGMPPVDHFVGPRTVWVSALLFLLFRVFDVAKPWPVRQSQSLSGGWGITVDDVLAALWVAGLSLLWIV